MKVARDSAVPANCQSGTTTAPTATRAMPNSIHSRVGRDDWGTAIGVLSRAGRGGYSGFARPGRSLSAGDGRVVKHPPGAVPTTGPRSVQTLPVGQAGHA